ncbi:MAG: hypothetical protein ACTSP4_00590 [Candidatus Hodarchaeales archaeon]
MYSEKLSRLIDDKASLKFRIKNKRQSKELQEFLFAKGVKWRGSGAKVLHTTGKCLYVDNAPLANSAKYLLIYGYDNENLFENKNSKEFDLENDCLVEENDIEKFTLNIEIRRSTRIDGL